MLNRRTSIEIIITLITAFIIFCFANFISVSDTTTSIVINHFIYYLFIWISVCVSRSLFICKENTIHRELAIEGTAVLEQPESSLSPEVKVLYNKSCVHEAGHVLMCRLLSMKNVKVHMNSCLPMKNPCISYEGALFDSDGLKKIILILYAGAAAEEIMFGEINSGCFVTLSSDFQQAEEYIKGYLMILDTELPKTFSSPEVCAKAANKSKEFYAEAVTILINHKKELNALINQLVETGKIDEKEISHERLL